MPIPWKKAKLRGLVSSLRSKAKNSVGDSPLVVQAGFPTSVADFVVKNRSRLKKTPRWRRPPSPTGDAGCSTMAVLASEIIALAVSSGGGDDASLSSPRDPYPEMDEQGLRPPVEEKCRSAGSVIGEEVPNNESHRGLLPGSEAAAVDRLQVAPMVAKKLLKVEGFGRVRESKTTTDGVDQRIPTSKADEGFPSCAPSEVPETEPRESSLSVLARRGEACGDPSAPSGAERKVPGGGDRGGFTTVAKMGFIVLVLAVVSKKVAIAVSALAFAVLFAESVGYRLIPLTGKKSLGAIPGSVLIADLVQKLGRFASNIRGGIPILSPSIAEPGLGPSLPWRNQVAPAPPNAAASAVETTSLASEEKSSLKIEGCRDDQESSAANRKEAKKKKKKLFRNIVPSKFRSSKGVKGGKAEEKLAPSQMGVQEETMEEEEEEKEEEKSDDDGDDEQAVPAMARDAGLGKPSKGSSGHLGFFVLILCGLIGGRVLALFLTVGVLCVSSAKSLWEGWNSDSNSLGALPDASTSDGLPFGREVQGSHASGESDSL